MKKLLTAVTALVAFAAFAPAHAADLTPPPVFKAPPPAPWYDWTGFYIGANGGYSWGNSSTSYTGTSAITGLPITPFSTSQSIDGWLGGGQIGYNWQFNHNWVLGLEADIQGTGQQGTAALPSVAGTFGTIAVFPFTTTGTLGQSLPWFGTARVRLGVEPADRWLVYATGGLAYGEVDSTATISNTSTNANLVTTTTTASSSVNNFQIGWTIGGGVEWAFANRWSAKLEYLYMDLGTFTNTFTGIGAYSSLTANSHFTDNIFRVGINYNFGGPH